MTAQLYHDTQATIRASFHCVALAREHCCAQPMFLWQIGTDGLENLFAVARTLTHAGNFDAKEFGDRLSAAVSLEEIYSKRPEWKRVSWRLNESLDHMNTRSWLDGGPEGGAEGNCDVRNVVLKSCWEGGRRDATTILQEHRDFSHVTQVTFEELCQKDVTMLRPFG